MKTPLVLETDLAGFNRRNAGKVRDIYDLGDTLLIVATDRISAFDVVLPNAVPEKGRVLTQISHFWFSQTEDDRKKPSDLHWMSGTIPPNASRMRHSSKAEACW